MAKSDNPQQIATLMEQLSSQQSTGKKLKYDPVKKTFVAVDSWDPSGDSLMEVTPTDLQSFAQ